jgi:hypothetical protein
VLELDEDDGLEESSDCILDIEELEADEGEPKI